MNIIDIKGSLHDKRIVSLFSHSHYMPTREKLNGLADKYESDPAISAFACQDNHSVYGVIILKGSGMGEFEIISIATDPDHRKQGIASRLVSFAASTLKCASIKAETDDDAVGFYRKYGFHIQSLGEKYPGTVRYLCTLK